MARKYFEFHYPDNNHDAGRDISLSIHFNPFIYGTQLPRCFTDRKKFGIIMFLVKHVMYTNVLE
jgi:hypothetical protein